MSLFIVSCQKTGDIILKNRESSSIDSINKYYYSSKEKSYSDTKRLNFINTAFDVANAYENDTLLLKTIIYKTQLLSINKDLDSALSYSHKMLRLSKKLLDTFSIGQAYYKLGLYHNNNDTRDSSYYYYNLSEDVFSRLNDSLQIGKVLLNKSIIQSDYGDYFGSDETAVKALKYLKSPRDNKYIASTYNCLAISSKKQKDYEESLYWYNMAIGTTKSEINRLRYSNNIANVYLKQDNYKKAISLYDSILKDSLVLSNLKTKARVIDNLTYAKWLVTGSEKLENDFIKALNIRINQNDLYGQIASNSHLSEYFEKRSNAKSIQYAERMYEISTQVNSIDDRLEALRKLLKSEKHLDKIKKYSEIYLHLNDSIIDLRESYKNKFAKIRYDTEKNRIDNFDLKIKNSENQLKLEKSNKQKTIYLFSGLLFILSVIFAYFLIKVRHKKEKLQQVYDTEKRISKKVHDEVANDVYHVMIKLQGDANNEAEVLDDLENIYEKTRDISKENSAIDLDENFKDSLNDLLLSYNSQDINIITKDLSKINWESISNIKKTTIYRVLQELMINMKKHSKASIAVLSFKDGKNGVTIEYKDNGVGWNLRKGVGLQNVENRIQSVNGIVTFESQTNKGFKSKIIV